MMTRILLWNLEAGGDEASLFAADLFSMYSKYAERQGWSIEVIDKNVTEVGGFK